MVDVSLLFFIFYLCICKTPSLIHLSEVCMECISSLLKIFAGNYSGHLQMPLTRESRSEESWREVVLTSWHPLYGECWPHQDGSKLATGETRLAHLGNQTDGHRPKRQAAPDFPGGHLHWGVSAWVEAGAEF